MTSVIHLLCMRCTEVISQHSGYSQVKLNKMSASLRNARTQISALQGRLEGLSLLNMDNVQEVVDRRVENITGMVNKLSSTCTTQCAVQNTPQCKPAFNEIVEYFSILTTKALSLTFSFISPTKCIFRQLAAPSLLSLCKK